jgi:hypothetical protein
MEAAEKDINEFGKMMKQVDRYIQTEDPSESLEAKVNDHSKGE